MIVVIADDISGAAELAGIGYIHGLSAEVQTAFDPTSSAQLLAVDTDSRNCPRAEAAARVTKTVHQAQKAGAEWIYKKTDSVLRGRVRAELTAFQNTQKQPNVLFIPANPGRGRTIRSGAYLIDNVPLNETVFATDPDYPATSSSVLELMTRDDGAAVHLLGESYALAIEGIGIPDIAGVANVEAWASLVELDQPCAGAGEFFGALLRSRVRTSPSAIVTPKPVAGPSLLICGTAAGWPVTNQECGCRGIPVFTLPPEVFGVDQATVPGLIEKWTSRVVDSLRDGGRAALAIGRPPLEAELASPLFLQPLVEAVAQVLHKITVAQLLMEGGATAAAVVHRLGWTRLSVTQRIGAGLAGLRPVAPASPLVCIKPGSYRWPEEIWR